MPWDCAHVWGWFSDLLLTRQVGMGDNPISYREIDAYSRCIQVEMEPWECRAIVELYWAYRSAVPTKSSDKIRNETDVHDGAGIKALMSGLASQKKPAKG